MNTFFFVNRFIGSKMSIVDEESKHVSYRVIKDDNSNVKLDCNPKKSKSKKKGEGSITTRCFHGQTNLPFP